MKILLIDPTCVYPGEAAKIRAFAELGGISLEVLTGDLHRDGTHTAKLETPPQIQSVGFHVGRVAGKFPNRTLLLSKLRRSLNNHPDVILAYSDWDHLLTLEIALLKAIVTPKSKLLFQIWENQFYTWKSHPQPNMGLYLLDRFASKIIFATSDGAMARSAQAAEVLIRAGFSKPVKVIPWGVDLDLFEYREPVLRDPFVVGYVGRLVKEKGVDDLLRAVEGIPRVKVIIAGAGPEDKDLEQQASHMGIDCQFVGHVPQDRLPETVRQMNAVVLPSRTTKKWAEQFGRAAVEAMAMGVPAIGSDCGAIPWVIGDPELIYSEGDVEVLRKIILWLQADPDAYRRKAQAAQRRARHKFNWGIHARATVEFCREISSC